MLELMVGFGVKIIRPSKNLADPSVVQIFLSVSISFNFVRSGNESSEISFFSGLGEVGEHHDPMEKYAVHKRILFDKNPTISTVEIPLLQLTLPNDSYR